MTSRPYIPDCCCSRLIVDRTDINAWHDGMGRTDGTADNRSSGLLREYCRMRKKKQYHQRFESLHDVQFSPPVTAQTQHIGLLSLMLYPRGQKVK